MKIFQYLPVFRFSLARRRARSFGGIGIFVAMATLAFGGEFKFMTKVREAKIGMTETQVAELLGTPDSVIPKISVMPNTSAWHFRFASLARRFDGADAVIDSLAAGRVRVLLRGGVVIEISGLWPKLQRPPSGTPKSKIMLVDVSAVYDRSQSTVGFNAELRRIEGEKQAAVAVMNDAGNALVAEYAKTEEKLKRFKGSEEDKQAIQTSAKLILGRIEAKKQEVVSFASNAQAELSERMQRYMDLRIPFIADAILKFEQEHGYDYVFEIKANVLSSDTKPAFVAGVDVTDEIVKRIDAQTAVKP